MNICHITHSLYIHGVSNRHAEAISSSKNKCGEICLSQTCPSFAEKYIFAFNRRCVLEKKKEKKKVYAISNPFVQMLCPILTFIITAFVGRKYYRSLQRFFIFLSSKLLQNVYEMVILPKVFEMHFLSRSLNRCAQSIVTRRNNTIKDTKFCRIIYHFLFLPHISRV